ncbi:MAG TPA: nuclear transport factor 2 family protein [Syntrophorhabdaceae bacterium]|nr:nuclear transport factor 2 family protein [Syntrophorhabdaceae bacterium]
MTIDELEIRLKALEDIEAIKNLHREYLFWISGLEVERTLSCFTDDIEVEVANYGIRRGKEDVAEFFRNTIFPNVLQSKDGHFTGQPVIHLNGEKASGHWMFYRFVNDQARRWIQGRYDCEYRKEDGNWKFSVLKMRRPWPKFLAEKSQQGT